MDELTLRSYPEKIFHAVTDGLMVVREDGTISMVNPALVRLTGHRAEELTGSPCTILNCDVCEIIQSRNSDKWCRLFEIGSVKDKRCVLMRKDGSYASAIKNAFLLKGENGKVTGAFEMFRDISELERREREIHELSKLVGSMAGFQGVRWNSPAMQTAYQHIETAAQGDAPVIIYGEKGTGKKLAAHAIHQLSRRRNGPFIQFNCSALVEPFLESELFGHVKGAFPGAYRHRIGLLESARGGEIFLDDICALPLSVQDKLLRVIKEEQFQRLGDARPVWIDVRVIGATSRNLLELVSQGRFRQDLFFALNAIPIYLPSLRQRREDVPLLVDAFVRQCTVNSGKPLYGVRPEVMDFFIHYDWPENITELKGALQYAFLTAESGPIDFTHLPSYLGEKMGALKGKGFIQLSMEHDADSDERAALLEALRLSKGNKTKAAKILGVHRMTVWNRMKKHGIEMTKKVDAYS